MKNLISLFVLLFFTTLLCAQEHFQVEKLGKGQPVLLFPGFTCTDEVYNDIKPVLKEHFEVHAFTFAGFGEVPAIEFPWLPKIKDAISAYVAERNLEDPIIIGHSMGGTLGLWLAAEHPGLYSKIIVVDALPAMGALMFPGVDTEQFAYDTPYNEQVLNMDPAAFRTVAEQTAAAMTLNVEKRGRLIDWMVQADRKTYVYGYTDLLKIDLRNQLKNITDPVSILGATHPYGKEVAEQTYTSQYANLKDYHLNFAEGSAHFIMYDKPTWFLEQLKNELNIQ